MPETSISWCHYTMNFWVGCTRVSPACDNCYAADWAKRSGWPELWEGSLRRTGAPNWRKPEKWNRAAESDGRRARVFSLSLGDFFDNQADPEWRQDAWAVIAATPNLDWLILTKRPQNIAANLPEDAVCKIAGQRWPWHNVWLGITAEDQERFDQRWPYLAAVPACRRFISAEPLLGPLDLNGALAVPSIDLVITGGESGPQARPTPRAYFRAVRDQCCRAGIAYHHKQNGEWIDADAWMATPPPGPLSWEAAAGYAEAAGKRYEHFSDGSTLVRVGMKAAGRALDGKVWAEMP